MVIYDFEFYGKNELEALSLLYVNIRQRRHVDDFNLIARINNYELVNSLVITDV